MANNTLKWYHLNRYNTLPCEHCDGIIRHASWCMCVAPDVLYAYEIAADPSKLTVGDALILHALGVAWDDTQVGELVRDICLTTNFTVETAHLGVAGPRLD
jgi:hypothetical protein